MVNAFRGASSWAMTSSLVPWSGHQASCSITCATNRNLLGCTMAALPRFCISHGACFRKLCTVERDLLDVLLSR